MTYSSREQLETVRSYSLRIINHDGTEYNVNTSGDAEAQRRLAVRLEDAKCYGYIKDFACGWGPNVDLETVSCSEAETYLATAGLPGYAECEDCGVVIFDCHKQCAACYRKRFEVAAANAYGDEQVAILAGAFPEEAEHADVLQEVAAGRRFDDAVAKMPMRLISAANAVALARSRR